MSPLGFPSGRLLATGGRTDRRILLRDAATFEPLVGWPTWTGMVKDLAFDATGRWLAVAGANRTSDSGIWTWSVTNSPPWVWPGTYPGRRSHRPPTLRPWAIVPSPRRNRDAPRIDKAEKLAVSLFARPIVRYSSLCRIRRSIIYCLQSNPQTGNIDI